MSFVIVEHHDHETIINITGQFNFELHSQFRNAYLTEMRDEDNSRLFTIDLADTTFIDTSGLAMLLLLREEAGQYNDDIVLANISNEARFMLEKANFHRLFKMPQPSPSKK